MKKPATKTTHAKATHGKATRGKATRGKATHAKTAGQPKKAGSSKMSRVQLYQQYFSPVLSGTEGPIQQANGYGVPTYSPVSSHAGM
jgi:hypothetical protein